jgi:hypothetical protein
VPENPDDGDGSVTLAEPEWGVSGNLLREIHSSSHMITEALTSVTAVIAHKPLFTPGSRP